MSADEDMQEMENSEKTKLMANAGGTSCQRHCAVCLKACSAKVCSGCKKRAYCSKECQVVDWAPGGKGQGHKNWCRRYECGEEDVDWQVVVVPGKGLGVVAKKCMPPLYRIIVEPVFTDPYGHPGIKDLEPSGGTLEEKFNLNSLDGDPTRNSGKPYVGLRISRVNHDCKPNAGQNYDEKARVHILYAQREIQPGEEICFSYRSFGNISPQRPLSRMSAEAGFMLNKQLLLRQWGITCPDDCFCNDTAIKALIVKGRQLNAKIEQLAVNEQPEAALEVVQELLAIQDTIHCSFISKANTHFTAFQIAIMSSSTLEYAHQYIRTVYQIYSAICPYSKDTARNALLMANPEADINYLSMERRY